MTTIIFLSFLIPTIVFLIALALTLKRARDRFQQLPPDDEVWGQDTTRWFW